MAELILPGVYIDVRAEALIVPGPISVGNIGIVGTASRGPIGEVQILSGYSDAREIFGAYDPYDSPFTADKPLTLVRALELAYANGASTVFAVRVTSTENAAPTLEEALKDENYIKAWNRNTKARRANHDVAATGGTATVLKAKGSHGSRGNDIKIKIEDEPVSGGGPSTKVVVTLKSGSAQEVYTVATGQELTDQINAGSTLVDATAGAQAAAKPGTLAAETAFTGGNDGADASDSDYALGLDQLLTENAHIIVAAGQDDTVIGDQILAHVNNASTDEIKRDRIGVIGSREKKDTESVSTFISALKPAVTGERIIYVAPGVKVTDAAADPPKEVTLPGAYAAAAVAGMLSARSPHISLTNKQVAVAGLEVKFSSGQLKQLLGDDHTVLALEERRGPRVVKGITTDTGAFRQITTRRIVDFAKFGVRSASDPYIGLLNNDRVRKALKGSINGFLAGMIDDEMITSYELDVTATRDEEIRGIAKVTMTLRPTFSIDYIKVVMFLG